MTNKDSSSYASFIGVNKAVIPGIRVLNDFLVTYYGYSIGKKKFKLSELKGFLKEEELKELGDVICKEQDENKKENLYKSFFKWINSYIYYSYDSDGDNGKFLIPITKKLLYKDEDAKARTRNIMYLLLYVDASNKTKYDDDKKNIERFLFNTKSNSTYGRIISIIDNVIENISDNNLVINEPEPQQIQEDDFDICISNKFLNTYREDFDLFIKSSCFMEMNIYRKINFFSLLLNFYETLYLINKAFEDENPIILAKGMPSFSTESGKFHHAALGSFSDIREKIFRMSEVFFDKMLLKEKYGKTQFKLDTEGNLSIRQDEEEQRFENSKISKMDSLGTNDSKKIEKHFIEYFQIDEKGRYVEHKEMARAIVELHKKMSSSVRMVSSMLSGQGKEAGIVHPNNRIPKKYFAMSGEITEMLLMLFLTQTHSETGFATLTAFLGWLEKRYGIYISFSDKLKGYLNKNSIQVPSEQEFTENVQAFIYTLESINAILKLSDTSYIVCMPGKVGGVPQI